ncbi:type IV toxin-antitoxin system AbiEi family antitoxin domain-containing protein [Kribbella sp. NBC_00889]|uniref:type IV toxin-antitoxin system AbiEi family antitoxin domain-containing protein n=1 Tax=Kribbella sp. NBC_00889 TaxID=2975974 RepID=UPI003866A5F5
MLIAAGRGDWFTRADACAAGYTDADIHRRVTSGRWVRLTRGAYAQPVPRSRRWPRGTGRLGCTDAPRRPSTNAWPVAPS